MESSKFIKSINKEAVHKICSGQVVLNLAIAVKELVENSLDAGSTTIEIRLREYGSDLIEVIDNGSGVESNNFQGLTLKHHTSKLQDFSDLVSVETFGFRGEALSSLCSLSNVTVTTRHCTSPCATRLVFDHNGKIVSSSAVARQVGTTVSLENIFITLPVRQKEFHRNLKREFGKMTQLLYAYCLVSTGVKITCTNQAKKGGRTTIVSTQGNKTVRENIACVFGTKQLSSLVEVSMVPPGQEALDQLNVLDVDVDSLCQLEGFVSSCVHGQGRATNDRQFYYVNSRPCEPTKVMKAVNEAYHQFNMHQQPFVFLNMSSTRDSVDVNVTPDKRKVFLEHEKILVATVKASLLAVYENVPSTFTLNNIIPSVSSQSAHGSSDSPSTPQDSLALVLSQWRSSPSGGTKRSSVANDTGKQHKQAKLDLMFSRCEKTTDILNDIVKRSSPKLLQNEVVESTMLSSTVEGLSEQDTVQTQTVKEIDTDDKSSNPSFQYDEMQTSENRPTICTGTSSSENSSNISKAFLISIEPVLDNTDSLKSSAINETDGSPPIQFEYQSTSNSPVPLKLSSDSPILCPSPSGTLLPSECFQYPKDNALSVNETSEDIGTDNSSSIGANHNLGSDSNCTSSEEVELGCSVPVVDECESGSHVRQNRCVEVCITIDDLRQRLEKSLQTSNTDEGRVRFRAIIDPSKNNQAEQELSREISKDMFSKMEIVGQFNLGFIISRLNSDLFIIDQHATDEKYNFETLQRTTTISNQRLVIPLQLELTAMNEAILMDNLEVFKVNGFEFAIDENASTTKKVKLTCIPMSRNWAFGKEDIDELLFMLQDAPNTLCRPSRVRAMFASRACRKSVMIGSALSKSDMRRLVNHMGDIEQPWNCPHGRPTMRHLINLDFV